MKKILCPHCGESAYLCASSESKVCLPSDAYYCSRCGGLLIKASAWTTLRRQAAPARLYHAVLHYTNRLPAKARLACAIAPLPECAASADTALAWYTEARRRGIKTL